jgi:hypothetical protein
VDEYRDEKTTDPRKSISALPRNRPDFLCRTGSLAFFRFDFLFFAEKIDPSCQDQGLHSENLSVSPAGADLISSLSYFKEHVGFVSPTAKKRESLVTAIAKREFGLESVFSCHHHFVQTGHPHLETLLQQSSETVQEFTSLLEEFVHFFRGLLTLKLTREDRQEQEDREDGAQWLR